MAALGRINRAGGGAVQSVSSAASKVVTDIKATPARAMASAPNLVTAPIANAFRGSNIIGSQGFGSALNISFSKYGSLFSGIFGFGAQSGSFGGGQATPGSGTGAPAAEGTHKDKNKLEQNRKTTATSCNVGNSGPDTATGAGYGVSDLPVRIKGAWTEVDIKAGLQAKPPPTLGRPGLHHARQMPGSAIHEALPKEHRGNPALHPNPNNQGVTQRMREEDRKLHWWYRAREEGADRLFPDDIYDP